MSVKVSLIGGIAVGGFPFWKFTLSAQLSYASCKRYAVVVLAIVAVAVVVKKRA